MNFFITINYSDTQIDGKLQKDLFFGMRSQLLFGHEGKKFYCLFKNGMIINGNKSLQTKMNGLNLLACGKLIVCFIGSN